jgi:membrane protease subunit HflK
MQEAEGYKEQVIAQAEGETSRFSKLFAEYSKAPDITRKRLYIESMEAVFSETNTVMVDVKGGNNMLYLPLDKMIQPRPFSQPASGAAQTATDQAQAQPHHIVADEHAVDRSSIRGRDTRGR